MAFGHDGDSFFDRTFSKSISDRDRVGVAILLGIQRIAPPAGRVWTVALP
jgi:hypothetical protein